MNTLKRLREYEIERYVETYGVDTIEEAEIEAERLYPEKKRAKRRKDTMAKITRLRRMRTTVYGWDEEWSQNAKKDLAVSRWYGFPDDYDYTFKQPDYIKEGLADYEYYKRVEKFYKLIDQCQKL